MSKLLAVLGILLGCLQAEAEINFIVSSQGYWYGKSYGHFAGEKADFEKSMQFMDEVGNLSGAERLCFLREILAEDKCEALTCWNEHFKNKQIPPEHEQFLKKQQAILQKECAKYQCLFDKIQRFWGVEKKCDVYCILSSTDNLNRYHGGWIGNFDCENKITCIICLTFPQVKRPVAEYISIIAHEFSHAMCDAKFGRKNFENISKFVSRNARIANWYLNEVLAILLGNCITRESMTNQKVDPSKEEYCALGWGKALYDVVKQYWDGDKNIDEDLIETAGQKFEELYPDAHKNLNVCLYNLCIFHADTISENDVMHAVFAKTVVGTACCSDLEIPDQDIISRLEHSNDTVMIVYESDEQLESIGYWLPDVQLQKNVEVISDDQRTYIFLKIDAEHSLQDCVDELFQENSKDNGKSTQ